MDPITANTAIKALETAHDALPQATTQVDGILATLLEWVQLVPLKPIHKDIMKTKQELADFGNELKRKTSQIPNENLQDIKPSLLGPTLEALKYTYDEEKLRSMYVNLLASAMDSRNNTKVHPSYVEIIKQMDAFDAVLFKFLFNHNEKYIPAINPRIQIIGTNQIYINNMPEWYIQRTDGTFDVFQTSSSLVRLSKLGIIELMLDRTAGEQNRDKALERSPQLVALFNDFKTKRPHEANKVEITAINSIVEVNDYGKDFALVCLRD